MSNTDIYATAKTNLLAKKTEQGYVQLVTDCWGMVVEFELEWHRQNGGTSQVNSGLMPDYASPSTMIQEVEAMGSSLENIISTLGWDILAVGTEKQDGDIAICTVNHMQDIPYWTAWFWNNNAWEISAENSHELVRQPRLPVIEYHLRKRAS